MSTQSVEFKTIDGILLRGTLYPRSTDTAQHAIRGPAVILTPGFACVKEMFVPEVAESFQRAGVTALIYDPRNTGSSDGEPRQELDPQHQVSDYSDALTFLSGQADVDPARIAFWGFSFAAIVALCAAALDKRASHVIACCPLTDYSFDGKKAKVLAKSMKDRESIVSGNAPFALPILTDKGESVAGFGGQTDPENYRLIQNAFRNAPLYQNRATIQTYYKIAAWNPLGLVPMVAPTPAFVLTPENDVISKPEAQKALFESIGEGSRKQQHIEPGRGHMDIFAGESFPKLMDLQVQFLKQLVIRCTKGNQAEEQRWLFASLAKLHDFTNMGLTTSPQPALANAMPSATAPIRVLCLHGLGTGSNILKSQLSPVLSLLPSSYSFVFLDGPVICDPSPGVAELYDGPYRCWFNTPTNDKVAQAYKHMQKFLDDNVDRPFDVVIGFSQGAALVAGMLLREQLGRTGRSETAPTLFKAAMFICSPLPFSCTADHGVDVRRYFGIEPSLESLPSSRPTTVPDYLVADAFFLRNDKDLAGLATGFEDKKDYKVEAEPYYNMLHPDVDTVRISIPTAHVYGKEDSWRRHSMDLVRLCEGANRICFQHDGGHEIPRAASEEICDLFEELIARAGLF
ncbi:hypothetical protein NHJ13051_009573 [Beauveria bassiana]